MSALSEEALRRHRAQELAFFGEIGASVSHEMRNVLSVVAEYAGLLDDLLVGAEGGKPLDPVRLKKLATGITRQVAKGAEVARKSGKEVARKSGK